MVYPISYQDNLYLIYTTCKPYVRGQKRIVLPTFFFLNLLVSCASPRLLLELYETVDYYHVRQLFNIISDWENHTMHILCTCSTEFIVICDEKH